MPLAAGSRIVAGDRKRLARVEREGHVLASVNHPNIAAIQGLAESESGPVLVLELVDGLTLENHLASGPLALDVALKFARQIADALEAAHEQGATIGGKKMKGPVALDDGDRIVFGAFTVVYRRSADGMSTETRARTARRANTIDI